MPRTRAEKPNNCPRTTGDSVTFKMHAALKDLSQRAVKGFVGGYFLFTVEKFDNCETNGCLSCGG